MESSYGVQLSVFNTRLSQQYRAGGYSSTLDSGTTILSQRKHGALKQGNVARAARHPVKHAMTVSTNGYEIVRGAFDILGSEE